jgi:hypothetical protein
MAMAELTKDDIFDAIRDGFVEAMRVSGGSSTTAKPQSATLASAKTTPGSKEAKEFDAALKRTQETLLKYEKDLKRSNKTLEDQAALAKRAAQRAEEQIESLEEFIDVLDQAGKTEEAAIARQRLYDAQDLKARAEEQAAWKSVQASMMDSKNYTAAFGTVIKQVATTTKGVMTDLQGNAGAATTANTLMTGALTLAGKAGSAAGSGLEAVGAAGMTSTNRFVKMGAAATYATGALLKIGAPALTEAAIFAIGFLGREFDNLAKGFRQMSQSGAMFANGMQGMIDAAGKANLTLQQFGEVVRANSQNLAESGLGMTEAVKRLGAVKQEIDKSGVGVRLQKLGFTFEEQAGLVAEVMGQMNRYGKGRMVSDQQLSQETEKYAKDLRLLAGLTGQDAKGKMEQAKAQANQLAFQNKLAEMAPEQAAAIQRAMAGMSEQQRKDFMEMQVFGTVVNKTGALMMANSQGYANTIQQFSDAANRGVLTTEAVVDIQAQNQQAMLAERQNFTQIGMAAMGGVGGLEGVAAAANATIQDITKFNLEAVEEQKKALKSAAETQNKLTNEFMAAQKVNQDLMVAQQNLALNNITEYVELVKKMNSAIKTAIDGIRDSLGEKTVWEKIKDNLLTFGGALLSVISTFALVKGTFGGRKGPPAIPTATAPTPTAPAGGAATGRPTGGMNPAQRSEYDRLRAQGVGATEAKAQATTSKIPGPRPPAAPTTVPGASAATPASAAKPGLLSRVAPKALALGKAAVAAPATKVLAAGAAGYSVGTLINQIPGFQEGLGRIVDRVTGLSARREAESNTTPFTRPLNAPTPAPAPTAPTPAPAPTAPTPAAPAPTAPTPAPAPVTPVATQIASSTVSRDFDNVSTIFSSLSSNGKTLEETIASIRDAFQTQTTALQQTTSAVTVLRDVTISAGDALALSREAARAQGNEAQQAASRFATFGTAAISASDALALANERSREQTTSPERTTDGFIVSRIPLVSAGPLSLTQNATAIPAETTATTGGIARLEMEKLVQQMSTEQSAMGTVISPELAALRTAMNSSTRELREGLSKQLEVASASTGINEQMLSQIRESNSLIRQLINVTA